MARSVHIVGAGHAGTSAARVLREHGWNGDIVLITGEQCRPYERPPLSKALLTGDKTADEVDVFGPGWIEKNAIQFRPGARVDQIDRHTSTLRLAGGETMHYEFLLLATGAKARLLAIPGISFDGVLTLRSLAQSGVLRQRLLRGKKLVVIGGGLIGLEVAASAGALGVETMVVEKAPTLLSRVMPASIAERITQLHRSRGTKFILGADVEAIIGDGVAAGVQLKSGQELEADTVLVAIGGDPDVELARAAGLAADGGIIVDRYLQTSDPSILAAGDVARYPSRAATGTIRSESWKNALDQGATAALNILGRNEPYEALPWMWSDQFEQVVQVVGTPNAAQTEIGRQLDGGGLATFSLGPSGQLEAAAAFGHLSQVAKLVRVATMIIDRGLGASPSLLADPNGDLRAILRSSASAENSRLDGVPASVNQGSP